MTNELENKREETIKSWQEKYKNEIKSCMDEIQKQAIENPTASTCVIRRKKTTDEFKIALSKACEEQGMVATFGWFGKIKVWFHDWEYLAAWYSV